MDTKKTTLFISDLHLDENHPEITACFLRLLAACDASVDALYILGDMFEAWIGDDDHTPFHRQIIAALRSVTSKGIPVYFMYGNRDFLIGKEFLRETGCRLLPDEAKINLYGTPVLLMHGDTLCTQDLAYMKARKKARNILWQKLFLILPLSLRKRIANGMRMKSTAYTRTAPAEIMDVTQDEIQRVMRKHGVAFLIHGHTHKPAFHDFVLDQSNAQRIVLGAWHERGNVLIWDDSGKKQWQELNLG